MKYEGWALVREWVHDAGVKVSEEGFLFVHDMCINHEFVAHSPGFLRGRVNCGLGRYFWLSLPDQFLFVKMVLHGDMHQSRVLAHLPKNGFLPYVFAFLPTDCRLHPDLSPGASSPSFPTCKRNIAISDVVAGVSRCCCTTSRTRR